MKKLLTVALAVVLLSPALAFAGASTDAALGLGAFAVFNQILSGTGIFGGLVGAPAPVVIAPAPAPVVIAPPPAVVAAPPVIVTQPYPAPYLIAPPPVIVARPSPVFVAPHPGYWGPGPVYRHVARPVYRHAPPPAYRPVPHRAPVSQNWCPPGQARHGRC